MRFLEKTLAHRSHSLFIFPYFLRDSNQHAQFRREVNILPFLFDFKQRLVQAHDLFVVLLAEILDHRNCLTCFTLFKARSFWAHVPSYTTNFVGFMVTITCHNNSMFEFIVNSLLYLDSFGWLSGIALPLLGKAHHLFIDQFEAVVDREVLADIVDD